MARIGIDLDICVIKSDEAWYHWLQSMCGGENEFKPWPLFRQQTLDRDGIISYNLSEYFPEPKNKGVSPYDYWRSEDCYAMAKVVDGAVKAITELKNQGHEIVFITSLKGNSHRSKYHLVERHFNFDFGFIGTKEKYLVNVDWMIDDRVSVLEKFPASVKCILFDSPYGQHDCETYEKEWQSFVNCAENWEEVINYIK